MKSILLISVIINLSLAASVTLDIGKLFNYNTTTKSIDYFSVEVPVVHGQTKPLIISVRSSHDPYASSFNLVAYNTSVGSINFTSFTDQLDVVSYQVLYVPPIPTDEDEENFVTIDFALNNNYLFGPTTYTIDPEVADDFGSLTSVYSSIVERKIDVVPKQRLWFTYNVVQTISTVKLIVENCDSLNNNFDSLRWYNSLVTSHNIFGGSSMSTTCNWGSLPANSIQSFSISPVARVLAQNFLLNQRYFFSITSETGGNFQIKFLYNVANDQTQLNPGLIRIGNDLGVTGVAVAESYDLYAIDYNSYGDTCYLEKHSSDKKVTITPKYDITVNSQIWNVDYLGFFKKYPDAKQVSIVVNQPDNGYDKLGMCSQTLPTTSSELSSSGWPIDAIIVAIVLGVCLLGAIGFSTFLLITRSQLYKGYNVVNK